MADYKIFLSACEASAEKHCVELMRAIRLRAGNDVNITFSGIGGNRMRQEGCDIIAETVSKAAMIYNAFGQVGYYYKLINQVKRYFIENKQNLVIVCDSPAFNFHVAKAAKRAGTKVLFYVAPQLWAWGPWRIHKLRRCCDKLACILPFEQAWFCKRGVDAEFVGNPLFDELEIDVAANTKSYDGYDPHKAKIALLPGSRNAEIQTLWQPMQEIAMSLGRSYEGMWVTAVAPDAEKLAMLKSLELPGFKCDYSVDSVINTCTKVDYTFVASGSATLQVAAAGCPMTIMYQSSKLMWHLLGKFLINLKKYSLVNILAGKELVPEYMPYFNSIEPIIAQARTLIRDKASLAKTSIELTTLTEPLSRFKTCDKVADIVLGML